MLLIKIYREEEAKSKINAVYCCVQNISVVASPSDSKASLEN
jgi:hypothetical protein